MTNYKKKQIFFLVFSLILIFIFFYFELIHQTYVPFWKDSFNEWPYKTYSNFKYFGDTQTVFLAAECHKAGFDVFKSECLSDYGIKSGHDYGRSLLFLPLIDEEFKSLFLITYGSILITTLIFLIFKLIDPKTIYENIICLILIFNPTTLLLFERLNFDLVIFLSLILIVFLKKNYILKTLIKFLVFSFKYYPLIFMINFFIEDKLILKKKVFYSSVLIFSSIILIFLNLDDFQRVVADFESVGRNIRYSFSLNAFTRLIDHLDLINKDITKLILFLTLIIFSIVVHVLFTKKVKIPLEYNPRIKLFFISSNLLLILYFFFNNNYFREVFFIGVIPYLLISSNKECLLSKICYLLIIFKYILMILFWPKVMFADLDIDLFAQMILGFKIVLDYITIGLLTAYMLRLNILVFKRTFNITIKSD